MSTQKTVCKQQICFNFFICLVWLFALVCLDSRLAKSVWADDVKKGDMETIVTPGTEARLCPQPACAPGQHITRIPEGTVFTIQDTDVFAIGTFKVQWFEVIYDEQHGWISIYDTDKAKK